MLSLEGQGLFSPCLVIFKVTVPWFSKPVVNGDSSLPDMESVHLPSLCLLHPSLLDSPIGQFGSLPRLYPSYPLLYI